MGLGWADHRIAVLCIVFLGGLIHDGWWCQKEGTGPGPQCRVGSGRGFFEGLSAAMLPAESSTISDVISSCLSRRKSPVNASSLSCTFVRAAIIALMRASFSAANDSMMASQSCAKMYSSASCDNRRCGARLISGGLRRVVAGDAADDVADDAAEKRP